MLDRLQYKKWAMEDWLKNTWLSIGVCLFVVLVILFAFWFANTFLFYEDGDEVDINIASIKNTIFILPALRWVFVAAAGSGGFSCFVLLLFSIFDKEFICNKSVRRKIYLVSGMMVFCFMLAWGIWLMPIMSIDILNHHQITCLILRWVGMSVGILVITIAFVAIYIFLE